MAVGTDANILAAMLERLGTLAFTPALEVAYPGRSFPVGNAPKPDNYLEVTFLPNDTQNYATGNGQHQNRGFLQISVHWKTGAIGMIKPLDIAGQIITHFDKDTSLYSNGVKVKVYRKPWAAAPIQETDRVQIPVTIPYESFNE